MTYSMLNVPYATDIGNGFAKRVFGKGVRIDSSVYTPCDDFYSDDQFDSISFDQSENGIIIGNDVLNTKFKALPALGDDDEARYASVEFKQLSLLILAKDLRESVIVPHLVTGLPVNHFKKQKDFIKKMLTGKKIVYLNDEELMIDIQHVHVLPQPLGTYMYLVANGNINAEDEHTLVIDGGFGSVDVTELHGKTIVNRAGAEIGVKNAYIEIKDYLINKLGESKNLTVANMPNIIRKGVVYDGSTINVLDFEDVRKILKQHFDEVFSFIRDNRFDLKSYNNVVWTGGMAALHKEHIEDKQRNNFVVLEDAQEANVKGYYEYGKALMEEHDEQETNPAIR